MAPGFLQKVHFLRDVRLPEKKCGTEQPTCWFLKGFWMRFKGRKMKPMLR